MSQKYSGKSVSSLYLINIHSDTSSIHTQASLQCTPLSASSSTVFIRPFPSLAWPRTAVSCLACVPCLQSASHSAFLLGVYLIMSYGHLRIFSSFPLGTSVFSSLPDDGLTSPCGRWSSTVSPSDPPYFVFLHATLPSMSDIPTNSPYLEDSLYFPPSRLHLCFALSAVPLALGRQSGQ